MLLKPPKVLLIAILCITVASLATMPAYAHESRTVSKYRFVVGNIVEPAFVDSVNALDLRVTNTETNKPVQGLEKTLKAEVMYGGKTMALELRTRFGQPGAYAGDYLPTRAGTYTFRIFGTIEGVAIDEKFTSGPNTFGDIKTVDDLQFPEKVPSPSELQKQMVDLQAQASAVKSLQGSVQELQNTINNQNGKIQQLESSKAQLQDPSNNTNMIAMGGIAVGTLGFVAGALGVTMAIRARSK